MCRNGPVVLDNFRHDFYLLSCIMVHCQFREKYWFSNNSENDTTSSLYFYFTNFGTIIAIEIVTVKSFCLQLINCWYPCVLNEVICISQGQSTYSRQIKQVEDDIQQLLKKINELTGIKESDTGLAPPALWDLAADKQTLQSEQPLQVARCTKIINADSEDPKYIINVKQFAKFVVDLSDQVAPTDIEEGMRVGVDRNKYQIHIPLPPKIDPTVTMMQVEEKPDVTYSDVGGCKEQIEKLREVVETPLLHVSGCVCCVLNFFV